MWGYCPDISTRLKVGDVVAVTLTSYDSSRDAILVSAKQAQPNDFEDLRGSHKLGDEVECTAIEVAADRIRATVSFGKKVAQAYIFKTELTEIIFVTEKTIGDIAPVGTSFKVLIKRFVDEHGLVELSRKQVLLQNHLSLEYGMAYEARVMAIGPRGAVVHTDRCEGILPGSKQVAPALGVG
jgi:ribosomal protein S1